MAADRLGEITELRALAPDAPVFAGDLAAKLADDGYDLVCVLGDAGTRTVLDLAARFPATRFCATGASRDDQPENVDVFDLAHEELGYVLGAAASGLADGGAVGLVRTDDRRDRLRRRDGALAALAANDVVIDGSARDLSEPDELVDAVADAELAVLLVDAAGTFGEAAAAAGPAAVLMPSVLTEREDVAPSAVAWTVRADVVIDAAVRRWLSGDEDVPGLLGFEDEVFVVELDEALPAEVVATVEQLIDDFVRGVRDPLEPVPFDGPDEDGPDEDEDGAGEDEDVPDGDEDE